MFNMKDMSVFKCLLLWAEGRDMPPNTKNENPIAYFITKSPIVDSHNMHNLFMANKRDVVKCETSGNCDPPCLIVTIIGENNIAEERRLYFVKTPNEIPPRAYRPAARLFEAFDDAYKWVMGKEIIPDKFDKTDVIAKRIPIPTIKRIEQNVKRGAIYTTVIWEDGSEPIVVKAGKGEPTSLYSAVAAAISIKMYGSNSAFKRMITEKLMVTDNRIDISNKIAYIQCHEEEKR